MPRDAENPADDELPVDLRTLLRAMSDAVLILNREGRWLAAAPTLAYETPRNRERLDFLIGRTFHEVEPEQADKMLATVIAALDTGQTQQIEYEVHRVGDRTSWFAAAVSPIDEDRVVWVARNVTDRVLARQDLQTRVAERTRELSVLLDVSRELTALRGLGELVRAQLEQMRRVIDYSGGSAVAIEGDICRIIQSAGPDGPENDIKDTFFPLNRHLELVRTILSNKPVIIANVRGDEQLAQDYRAILGEGIERPEYHYIRGWMAIPITQGGKVVAFISLSKDVPDYFTEHHLEMALAIAQHASVAAENAALLEETNRSTREISALYEISKALSSTLELKPLLELVLDELKNVVDYDGAGVLLRVEGGLRQFAVRRPESVAHLPEREGVAHIWREDGPAFRQVARGLPGILDDTLGDSLVAAQYRDSWGGDLHNTPAQYARSLLSVPLFVRDELIGAITLAHRQPGYYTEADVERVKTIAGPAATAIDNARLFEQTEARTREVSALFEISKALSSTLELEPLLNLMLDELLKIVDYDGAGVSLIVGDQVTQLAVRRPAAYIGMPGQGSETMEQAFGSNWEKIKAGEVAGIDDVWDDSIPAQMFRRPWGGDLRGTAVEYVHSILAVPLISRDKVIGTINLAHGEAAHYNEEHIALVKSVAGPAAAAIENARLFEQTQARTREMSALLEVSHAVVSTLDVPTLIGVILDQLQTILEHDGSSVVVREGDELVIVDSRAKKGAQREVGMRFTLEQSGILWQTVGAGNHMIIDDIRADEPLANNYRAVIGQAGLVDVEPFKSIRSWMAVPLQLGDQAIGMLTMSRQVPNYFTDEHAQLVGAFANQAAVALDNARLYEDMRSSARRLEALSRADSELFRSLDLNTVLQALVDVTVDVLGADKSMVSTWDNETRIMTLRAWRNLGDIALSYIRDVFDSGHPNMDGASVVVDEAASARPHMVPIIQAEGIQSVIEIPVRSAEGRPLGFFSVGYTAAHRFEEPEQRLLMALADRAAVAISNAELYARDRQLTALEERQRLARELHDSVSQALYGIALGARTARTVLDRDPLKAIEPVDYVLALAEAGLAEMRALIFELRPE
ncbi:MAG: GAF domain-containing protein, partial [Chloroflexota bacterium]